MEGTHNHKHFQNLNDVIDIEQLERLKNMLGESFTGLIPEYIGSIEGLFANATTAIEEQNHYDFKRAVHSMRSTSATIGAMTFSEHAGALEKFLVENGRVEDLSQRLQLLNDEYNRVETELDKLGYLPAIENETSA